MQCSARGKVMLPLKVGNLLDLKHTCVLVPPSGQTDYDPKIDINRALDLSLKLTASGVTFLHERRFKKRYTGSATCAIDHYGRLWSKSGDLKEWDINGPKGGEYLVQVKRDDKKKTVRVQPDRQMLLDSAPPGADTKLNAISEILPDCQILPPIVENFASNVAKKERKKSYKVDKAKVRQRIYTYLNTQKGKKRLFFWTISFPEGTPDKICYKAFNTWLTSLRQRGLLKDYLWIAERQEGDRLKDKSKAPTHTIHFHIAIPHYLDVHKANAMMRGTLKGYAKKGLMPGAFTTVSAAKTLRKVYYLPCIARYNGVDLCKHKHTKKPINFAIKKGARALAHYLTKYVTKNDAGQTNDAGELIEPGFDHLAWHCSRGFSRPFTGITCTLNEFKQAGFGGYLNRVRTFRMKYATFVPWLYGPPLELTDHLYKLNSFIQNLFDNGESG